MDCNDINLNLNYLLSRESVDMILQFTDAFIRKRLSIYDRYNLYIYFERHNMEMRTIKDSNVERTKNNEIIVR